MRNAIKPLQAIYRRARSRDGLVINLTRNLELPGPRPKEVEIVSAEVAACLLDAEPVNDRPLWAPPCTWGCGMASCARCDGVPSISPSV